MILRFHMFSDFWLPYVLLSVKKRSKFWIYCVTGEQDAWVKDLGIVTSDVSLQGQVSLFMFRFTDFQSRGTLGSLCSSAPKNSLCSECLRWHLHSVIFQGHNNKSVSDLAHSRVIVGHLPNLKPSISIPLCLFFVQLQSRCCVANSCWGLKMLKWSFPPRWHAAPVCVCACNVQAVKHLCCYFRDNIG